MTQTRAHTHTARASLPLLALAASALALGHACTEQRAPRMSARFTDDFNRAALGPEWNVTGSGWTLDEGALRVQGAHNHPLWLKRALPRNARVEFDAWSQSPQGDIKCEVYGDGTSYAQQASYTATSYVVIFGGWSNRYNVIARMDEHAPDRRQRVGPRVELGRRYHFVVERRDRVLRWLLDNEPMLEWDDPDPLWGGGHEHFAFNNWETLVHFDNLVITPL